MQKAKAQSAMRPPFLALAFIFVTAVILLALLLPPRASHAQGIVRGAQQGSYEGSRVAGPVGGIVGGAVGAGVGGAVGVVEGVFGTPNYRWRHSPNQSSTPRQPRSVARREQRVPTGDSQPGSTPPAPQDQAAPQAEAPARPAVTASTAPQDQAAPQAEALARPATTASTAPPVQPLE
jgi:hypothetical protein